VLSPAGAGHACKPGVRRSVHTEQLGRVQRRWQSADEWTTGTARMAWQQYLDRSSGSVMLFFSVAVGVLRI
jgi:hypothetical protein